MAGTVLRKALQMFLRLGIQTPQASTWWFVLIYHILTYSETQTHRHYQNYFTSFLGLNRGSLKDLITVRTYCISEGHAACRANTRALMTQIHLHKTFTASLQAIIIQHFTINSKPQSRHFPSLKQFEEPTPSHFQPHSDSTHNLIFTVYQLLSHLF